MSGAGFKDHFSTVSRDYARFRPTYPDALFADLAALAPGRALAWDCGCGTGQAAGGLARHFERVIATDASAAQIGAAAPRDGVDFRVAPAEDSGLEDASADLILAAQAAHWFDLPRFYAQVRRVAKPAGVLALVTYQVFTIAPELDRLIDWFYRDVTGPYWPPERVHVERGYADLPFPFAEVPGPAGHDIVADLPLSQVVGMLDTWSGLKEYRRRTGRDPLPEAARALAEAWGDPETLRRVVWAVRMRVGIVEAAPAPWRGGVSRAGGPRPGGPGTS